MPNGSHPTPAVFVVVRISSAPSRRCVRLQRAEQLPLYCPDIQRRLDTDSDRTELRALCLQTVRSLPPSVLSSFRASVTGPYAVL